MQGKGACGAVDRGGLKRSLFGSVKDLSREFYTSYVNGTVTTANADARGGKVEKKKVRVAAGCVYPASVLSTNPTNLRGSVTS